MLPNVEIRQDMSLTTGDLDRPPLPHPHLFGAMLQRRKTTRISECFVSSQTLGFQTAETELKQNP
jgi:hypothetical protein